MARRRYQKGSIRKRGKRNPVWELQWWEDYIKLDGSFGRKRESRVLGLVSEMTRRQALKAAEELLAPLNSGKKNPLSTITLQEFVDQFFVPNAFPMLKPSTRARYRRTLDKHLLPAFGNQRLCDISTLDLQTFVLKKAESGLGWESCDHLRNLMSRLFTAAKKWGLSSRENPASGVELPEKRTVREKHVLTPEQVARLLGMLSEPCRTIVLLGILAGLRVGEILGLRWKDVDLALGQLRVEQAVYRGLLGSPKTKGSRRTLPLPQELISVLSRFHSQPGQRADHDLVFQTRRGTPYSDTNLLHRVLKPAGQKIGAPWLNWHTLRRTHATLLQLAGGSLKDAQAQLGHSKLSTTFEVYTLPIPAHQRAAVQDLARLVTNGDELAQSVEELPVLTEQIQ
ncbi:MAG: site-specific integrase [Acidobacteriales bacterium]|nr:site-specific integrase [Terriglobales bacterium]